MQTQILVYIMEIQPWQNYSYQVRMLTSHMHRKACMQGLLNDIQGFVHCNVTLEIFIVTVLRLYKLMNFGIIFHE